MPGVRPAGPGNVATTNDVELEHEPTSQKTETTPPPQKSSNAPPPKNGNTMRGDLSTTGQMRVLQLKDALPDNAPLPTVGIAQAAPADLTTANALRSKMLPDQLEKANVPKDVRDELMKQISSKSGEDLKKTLDQAEAAAKSKDATGDVKSLVMQGRVDAYFQSFNQEYTLPNGSKVNATPHFRMTDGDSGPKNRTQFPQVRADLQKLIQTHDKGLPKDQQLWNPATHEAVKMVAAGKGSSEQVKIVTDALIKSGEFEKAKKAHPGLSDSETIRMMQWDHGVGIDCAGYVSQAFVAVHGKTRKEMGLQEVNNENLMYLKNDTKHYTQVKPTEIKPGDLIALDPPKKDDVGHTLLVRNHHIATLEERRKFLLTDDVDNFGKPKDIIHLYEVDASWGAGEKGNLNGGLNRRMYLFNERTGQWANVGPLRDDGLREIRQSSTNGPYDHPMNGIYRPK